MTRKNILALVLIVGGLFFAVSGIADNIKLNPIKPTAKVALTDEQQGVLAVRTAKASVVNIVGVTPPNTKAGKDALSVNLPPQSIAGTGFVLEKDGLIATNYHVIESEGVNYSVVLADGTTYPAKIVGIDKFDDIALIKIEANNLIPAKLGDSNALETGQSVFAIGNSLGKYQNSVTRGVVSGLSRAIDENQGGPTNHNWIQTDAAINVGNSGGPLINMAGEVVGMNTLIDLTGQSLGFAIPINTIKDTIGQLKAFGTVSRPYLGIQFVTIDPVFKLKQNLNISDGAFILSVASGSAADAGGLKANDVVTAINSQKLDSQHPLDGEIQKYQAGQQISMTVFRNGQSFNLQVILGTLK